MATAMQSRYKNNISIRKLLGKDFNQSNLDALKKELMKTDVNDKVIVCYSGHGLLSRDFDYFLSTYDVDFAEPEHKGLPYGSLEELLDGIPARKKLLLIDACHSGEVDKDDLTQMQRIQMDLDSTKKGGDAGIVVGNRKIGVQNSFELMQELFVNVGKTTGATVLSAASGTQFAYEKGDIENGVFTFSILEAFQENSKIKLSELRRKVSGRVIELTKGSQKPGFRNETIDFDWEL
jgi:hypothetical protein